MALANDFPEHNKLLELENGVLNDIKDYGECVGDSDKQPQRLEASIHSKLSSIRALTRDLELLVEELDSDEERQAVARLLTAHATKYNQVQQAFKAAALQRRQHVAKLVASERQQLLGTPEAALRRRQMANEADMVGASEGITESLRRTRQMMSEELEHTSATLAAMDASHTQLAKTRDEFSGQHGLLKRSKGLLKVIDWQHRSETILLWAGLIIFALTAAYVAQKRALYFVPEPLKPMTLLKTTVGLVKGGQRGSETALRGRPIPAPLAAPQQQNEIGGAKHRENHVEMPEIQGEEENILGKNVPEAVQRNVGQERAVQQPKKAVEMPQQRKGAVRGQQRAGNAQEGQQRRFVHENENVDENLHEEL